MIINFEDFTESKYIKLLELAEKNWQIKTFSEYLTVGRICLWRHDIDYSLQRALTLSRIERSRNFKATYFVNLHSDFYNLLEEFNFASLKEISKNGHDIGLHFDLAFYKNKINSLQDLSYWLKFESELLEKVFEVKIKVFSWHNPDIGQWTSLEQDEIGGLINVYGSYFKQNYAYCSDSNGYWRYRRLQDVLESAEDEKLQVLTHPGWWTPEPMSPRDRISRCIDGRAARQHQQYDKLLEEFGRENIR